MSISKPVTVVALGGNAILQRNEKGTFDQQYKNVRDTASRLADAIESGRHIVITHGNGPQIGATLIRHEMAKKQVPPLPLDACGAETQGLLGYMIQQSLEDELYRRSLKHPVVTIVTQVLVDKKDPAFGRPTKPIGPFYSKEQAEELRKARTDLIIVEEKGKGFRRVVPSPDPKLIVEGEAIRTLVSNGRTIAIACGGGGIPVVNEGAGFAGVEAVIDKDLAAERLASVVGAERLVILTDVEGVYLDYGKSNQRLLEHATTGELERYLDQGQFSRGSMEPKVRAVIRFIRNGGQLAVIGHLKDIHLALDGQSGTRVVGEKPVLF